MFVYRVSKIRCLQRLSMLFPWDFYRDIMNYYDIPSWKPRWTSKKLEDDWSWVVLYVFGFYNDRVLVLCVLLFKLNVSHGFLVLNPTISTSITRCSARAAFTFPRPAAKLRWVVLILHNRFLDWQRQQRPRRDTEDVALWYPLVIWHSYLKLFFL
jgi:hypothetical protein